MYSIDTAIVTACHCGQSGTASGSIRATRELNHKPDHIANPRLDDAASSELFRPSSRIRGACLPRVAREIIGGASNGANWRDRVSRKPERAWP
jgi:hypothetical protein